MEKYSLEDIFHNTFSCQFGYQHKYGASDFVQAIGATLEFGDSNFDPKQAVYAGIAFVSNRVNYGFALIYVLYVIF